MIKKELLKTKTYDTLNLYLNKINMNTCKVDDKNGVYEMQDRIIVIGDIHGDFEALLMAMYKAQCIDLKGNWTGGKTYVVQMGDFLDRGGRGVSIDSKDKNEEIYIIQFLNEMDMKAKKDGGRVLCLLGNHELMNIIGDLRYTSENTNRGFGGEENRRRLFSPGEKLAKQLACQTYSLIRIGDWVFVHAGLLPKHISELDNQNEFIPYVNNLVKEILNGTKNKDNLNDYDKELIFSQEGIFWTRILNDDCNLVNETVKLLKLDNGGIIVGHTVKNKIHSKCQERLWFSDVGMSKAFGDQEGKESYSSERVQILEINKNHANENMLYNKDLKKEAICENKEYCKIFRIF